MLFRGACHVEGAEPVFFCFLRLVKTYITEAWSLARTAGLGCRVPGVSGVAKGFGVLAGRVLGEGSRV